ncbi:WxcM-like domain-containing protein [Moheibacter sediminis]|uniref:WxcM-like, C-terminal n=1 Tax=Moheibacter sediminis TaxID=1434700 RepID=A0A1W2CBN0_9FLAO|nr:WxcM-like domain-containing protein [Moheibacter sediminis]SMC82394.1 WxcM-like, C-terminal [Moheibacter sediminis]
MMLLKGKIHSDERGTITFNNDFDASQVKRIYTIENNSVEFIRGWQGHKVEQRWFACINGKFEIQVIEIDDFQNPSKDLTIDKYELTTDALNFLHVPAGFVTAIQAIEGNSKLLVLSDYLLGEIQDEYRFRLDYFHQK